MRRSIGRFQVEDKLGEGGMGVVYVAHDATLGRRVAIKTLHHSMDPVARQRLLREARIAASVNHPHVCQVYEIGEDTDELYLVMELIDGEPLDRRLGRGPMPLAEALQTMLDVLSGLEALHQRDLVHRDLKPSNVFLAPHGAKLLDFGLSRPLAIAVGEDTLQLTQEGKAVGTPRYMAPEQWAGETATVASDLFAMGALFFEMLTAKPAFSGKNIVEVCEAVTRQHPPALSGGPAIVAAARVIQRALEKRPEDRYADAFAMAQDIRAARVLLETSSGTGEVAARRTSAQAQRTLRLIALPFRALRPDPETDFLAYGLADAVASSLSSLDSLVVRSSLTATRFATETPDLQALAREAEVDAVLHGTLMRAGDQLRVTAQLVEVPVGTLLWSKTLQASLGDLFQLQDSLVQQIVASLAVPLTPGDRTRMAQDVPQSTRAYELYLRANQVTVSSGYGSPLVLARDLYADCLEEDPHYAPAWARIARIYRLMGKYGHGDAVECRTLAQQAFDRALQLNPDLSIAHNYLTYKEVEEGRALNSMLRLVERGLRRAADPDLFAGLVVACRYCGLLEASIAADRRARRLDPNIRTSVHYTDWMLGNYERAMETDPDDPPFVTLHGKAMLGDVAGAIAAIEKAEARGVEGMEVLALQSTRAVLEMRREDCLRALEKMGAIPFRDPEGHWFMVRNLARVGALEEALNRFSLVVDGGFWCPTTFRQDPWIEPLRQEPRFEALVARAEANHRTAADAYRRVGGERLLGVPAS